MAAMSPLEGYLEVTPCPMVIVRKAPVIISHPKQKGLSNSQQILFTLLEKRFQRYVAAHRSSDRQKSKCRTDQNQRHNGVQQSRPARLSVQDKMSSTVLDVGLPSDLDSSFDSEDQLRRSHRSKATCYTRHRKKMKELRMDESSPPSLRPINQTSSTSSNALSNMGCTELAEHVVCRARNRLKRRPKQTANKLAIPKISSRTTSNHTVTQNWQQQKLGSNIVPIHQQQSPTLKLTQSKYVYRSSLNFTNPNSDQEESGLQESVDLGQTGKSRLPQYTSSSPTNGAANREELDLPGIETYSSPVASQTCTTTVYLSEKHSITPRETGIPNVPPPTPSFVHSRSFKYIQSMCDIKSQRQLKNRLHDITQRLKQKEATGKDGRTGDNEDKKKRREAIVSLKAKQRAEELDSHSSKNSIVIYALNAAMRKHEESKFKEFISGKV